MEIYESLSSDDIPLLGPYNLSLFRTHAVRRSDIMPIPQLTLVSRNHPRVSDKDLAIRIASVFQSDLAQSYTSGIHFFVEDGDVIVKGFVDNSANQQLLLFVLKQVPGVRRVINRSTPAKTCDYYKARIYYLAPNRAA